MWLCGCLIVPKIPSWYLSKHPLNKSLQTLATKPSCIHYLQATTPVPLNVSSSLTELCRREKELESHKQHTGSTAEHHVPCPSFAWFPVQPTDCSGSTSMHKCRRWQGTIRRVQNVALQLICDMQGEKTRELEATVSKNSTGKMGHSTRLWMNTSTPWMSTCRTTREATLWATTSTKFWRYTQNLNEVRATHLGHQSIMAFCSLLTQRLCPQL